MALEEKINAGRFVVLGEFEPPKGNDFASYLKHANQVRGRLDAFMVPEMASAVLKASSLGACALPQREGIETVFRPAAGTEIDWRFRRTCWRQAALG